MDILSTQATDTFSVHSAAVLPASFLPKIGLGLIGIISASPGKSCQIEGENLDFSPGSDIVIFQLEKKYLSL